MTDKKLHVLQVTGPMNRGGAEVMVMDIYRNLSPDVRFDFLINVKKNNPRPHGDFDDEILRLGGRLRYIRTQWDLWVIKYIIQFREIIKEIGTPDVIHIHLNSRCGIIALAAKLCGIKKIIAHCHGDLIFRGPFFRILPGIVELKLQKMLIALFATDYWGCSKVAIESLFYRYLINKGKTVIINNAINVKTFQSVPESKTKEILSSCGVKEDTLVLGNIGRIVRRKNVDFIIDVLKVLNEKGVNYIFIYAGREDDKYYINEIMIKAKEFNVEDRVLYLGDSDDVPALMSAFDVFIGPAHNEAFGMVAVEAQAAGLPCVLSTEFPHNIDMGLNLVNFINTYEPDRWADAILEARGEKCSNKELICRKIAEHGFDAAENTQTIEHLYRS